LIEALRIDEVGESSGLATVWIGVEFGALSFKEGSFIAHKCHTFIDRWGIQDYHIEIRESHVMRQAGNRFLDPVYLSNPIFSAHNPYTATLGIPISTKNRPWAEGTGGIYLSAGGDDNDIYLITARHVVFPLDKDDNKEYVCVRNDSDTGSKARDNVVILGTSGFNEKLAVIDKQIIGQQYAIKSAEGRIEFYKDMDNSMSVKACKYAGWDSSANLGLAMDRYVMVYSAIVP
jgi:hypothetical protein